MCNSDAQSTQRQEKAWQFITGTCQTSCQSHSWLKRFLLKGFSKKAKLFQVKPFKKFHKCSFVFFFFFKYSILPVWQWWWSRLDLVLSDQSDLCCFCFGFCSALVPLTPTSWQVFTFCSCFSLQPCFPSSSSSSFFILALWAYVCACVCACVGVCMCVCACVYFGNSVTVPCPLCVRMGPLSAHSCVSCAVN